MCFLICIICACLLALFKFGIVGSFFFNLISYFFGFATYVILILGIVYAIWTIYHNDKKKIPKSYIVGIIFVLSALLLYQGCREFQAHTPWSGFMRIVSNTWPILSGEMNYTSGLYGTLLSGIFASMFDYSGAFLISAIMGLIGIILLTYYWFANLDRDTIKEKLKKPRPQREIRNEIPISYETAETRFEPIDLEETPSKKKKKAKTKRQKDFGLVADEIPNKDQPKALENVVISQSQPKEKPSKKSEVVKRNEISRYTEDLYPGYKLPPTKLLNDVSRLSRSSINLQHARVDGQKLIEILDEFNIKADLKEIHIGPTVTKFEIKPELGVRVSRISNLTDDIKMALAATDIRIEAPIPGKNAVGIEVPNLEKTPVQMKDLMMHIPNSKQKEPLLFCLGKDLMGECVYGQLDKMPHLLIAGATGSGKSVCVNTIICSLLMRSRPDEVKLILIDPKKVEFTPYNDVPHLIAPVITDGDLANKALKVVVQMMDERYNLFGDIGVKNIAGYNEYVRNHPEDNLIYLPQIIVIIDELADLMLVAAKEVEQSIQRITQLARAAGIVLIVATQRPSVDVITGVIKSNIPSRIAFAVASVVDSRTILDQAGAERLLGYGDMLYLPNGENSPKRVQGVFIKDDEVSAISEFVKKQGKPKYDDVFITLKDLQIQGGKVAQESADPLYDEVKRFVIASKKASTSLIQRKFSIGYSRAARLIDVLEENRIIGPANGSKPREVLVQSAVDVSED
ncbi:FtsK/SpoIIIE family DNA translocase [Dubosiella newyorkensis]|uniref:FtsK/SpoIIIE family DNA translocase n=2 Tax=Dubosiella newyorkensis TaxID=1862672 RepID=UPI0023F56C97|nr:DNA translocase FtsK [Dubosiella newyorkensis]